MASDADNATDVGSTTDGVGLLPRPVLRHWTALKTKSIEATSARAQTVAVDYNSLMRPAAHPTNFIILKDVDANKEAKLMERWCHRQVDVMDPLNYPAGWRN